MAHSARRRPNYKRAKDDAISMPVKHAAAVCDQASELGLLNNRAKIKLFYTVSQKHLRFVRGHTHQL